MKYPSHISFFSIALIIVLGIGLYVNSLGGGFVRPDKVLISDNPAISRPSDIVKIFSSCSVYSYREKTFYIYRPIQALSYALDMALWGSDPEGYHLTNVILHILAAISLYWLLSLFLSCPASAIIASLFFLTHPAYSGAVSSISARADILSSIFAIMTCVWYVKYLAKPGIFSIIAVIFTFILSVLSCEYAIAFPVVLLFFSYQFKKRSDFGPLTIITFITLMYVWFRASAFRGFILNSNVAFNVNTIQRFPGYLNAVADQFKLLISPRYLMAQVSPGPAALSQNSVLIGIIITYCLLIIAFTSRGSKRLARAAAIWFLSFVFSMLIIYPMSGAYSVRQWLYLPSIGIFMLAGVVIDIAFARGKTLIYLISACIIAMSSYATIRQNSFWSDQVNIYNMTLEANPHNVKAASDLALAYEKSGKHDDATSMYNKMLLKDPKNPDIYVNLAAIQIIKRNPDSAIGLCAKAIELEPNNATAHNNMAVAYYMRGDHELAIKECDLALKNGYKVRQELLDLLKPYRQQ